MKLAKSMFTLSHSEMIESTIVEEWQAGWPGEPASSIWARGLGWLGYAPPHANVTHVNVTHQQLQQS